MNPLMRWKLLPNKQDVVGTRIRRQDRLLIKKLILEDCEERRANLAMSWVEKKIYCPPHGFWNVLF